MATFLGLAAIVASIAALLAIFSGERIVPKQPIHRLGCRFMRAEPSLSAPRA